MILKKGSKSNSKQAVRALSLLLGLAISDTYTAALKTAVKQFQKGKGLTVDGIAGPNTLTVLAKTLPDVKYKDYSGSVYVKAVQALVSTSIDGKFGSNTRKNVIAFQTTADLEQTGNVTTNDWLALWDCPYSKTAKPSGGTDTAQPVDYKQGDKRWGSIVYTSCGNKKQTIANSGCGPTSMADIMATWMDKLLTPVEMCAYAVKHGFRTKDSGTAWGFFKSIATAYGFTGFVQTKSMATARAALKAGAFVVASMGPGYWTSGGHFICLWKTDDTYMYANDPASSTRKKQKLAPFEEQRKQFFIFYKPKAASPFDDVDDGVKTVAAAAPSEPARGKAIVDISKYQPTVNYDDFVAATSLIILRAGYRGTGGGINEDQKFELHASELKRRGVRFGVYFFSIAINEEKAREEARMFYKWAKDYDPLFYAMDAENPGITKAAIVAFADELRKLGAKRVGCYVAHHLYQKYDYGSIQSAFDFAWIPRYGSNDGTLAGSTKPSYPCDLWQYTSNGWVNGITEKYTYKDEDGNTLIGTRGRVDLNVITGTGKSLTWFQGGDA